MANLLQTKIALPPLRRQYIHRDRVLQPVSASPAARLVLVSAPAGFGKSTALLQWAHHKREAGTVVAWYAVDDRDNDPARFAAYLLAAFRLAGVELSDGEEGIEVQEAVNLILNSVAGRDEPVLLLLDDYHLISEPQIHDAIRRLCEYMPLNMRLAIGSRVDPPLPLARLRSRGEMAEIRMADLRFNGEELRRWCDVSLGWTPSHSSVETLQKTTEGWAAALALIMMSRPHADEAGLAEQLARYSQSQRHIFDYFAQEILEHQPEELRRFLLDTCVLDQLAPQLCTAVADSPHAPLLLNRLAAASLFIIPLSNTEPIYRYHHLFAQFLRQYLTLKDRDRYLRQHRRAAQWYAAHDAPVAAVNHALAAEDFDYAARLIEDEAYAPLMSRGEFMTVVNWQSHFSTEALARHPRLWLYFIRALYLSGHIEMAETQVRLSEEALAQDGEDGAEKQALQAIACNYRATLAAYRGDLAAGERWIEQAKAREAWVGERDRLRIASAGAFIRYLMGDVAGARQAYHQTLAMAERLSDHWVMLDVHYYLAQLDLLSADLEAAEARCRRLLDEYPARLAPRTPLMLPLADVLYQRDQVVEAEALLRQALAQAESAGQPSTCFFAHLALSGILAGRGDITAAEASIAQARAWAEGYQSPMIEALIDAAAARVMLQCGQVEAATAWAADYQNAPQAGYEEDGQKITLARVWLAQGEPERALGLLAEIGEAAGAAGRTLHVIEAAIGRALAHQAAGEPDAALAPLGQALALAQPQQIVRLFSDRGRPMQRLLRRAVTRNVVSAYAQFLLDSAERGDAALHPSDLLTEREIEVLAEVATGASNQEIAETLVISVGTVKSHIHHIMSKLDAQNRTEAATKARSLNILPD